MIEQKDEFQPSMLLAVERALDSPRVAGDGKSDINLAFLQKRCNIDIDNNVVMYYITTIS